MKHPEGFGESGLPDGGLGVEPPIESRLLDLHKEWVAVNKLPGESSQGAGPGIPDLSSLLGTFLGESGFPPTPVHRLDVPVSGVILFARTPKTLSCLNRFFAQGRVEKQYWAIIEKPPEGQVLPPAGELIHWIQTDPRRNKSAAFLEQTPKAKKGILRYRLKGAGTHYLFLEIDLITGRHHQIRAQLAQIGLHIKGDLKYGARRSEPGGGVRLHSYSLSFPNPTGEEGSIRITAPPPIRDSLWEAFENQG